MERGLLGACTDKKSKYSQLMAFMIIWNIDLVFVCHVVLPLDFHLQGFSKFELLLLFIC